MDEPLIEINGVRLSVGQVMAVRAACTSCLDEMASDPDALGSDEHGRRMAAAYVIQLREVIRLLLKP